MDSKLWTGVGDVPPDCRALLRNVSVPSRVNRPVVMKLLRADSTFPLCASAAGLRCIMHEHSVNLLI